MRCLHCGCIFCPDDRDDTGLNGPRLYCTPRCRERANEKMKRLRKRAFKVRSCTGKAGVYATEELAAYYATRISIELSLDSPLRPYKCDFGDHWHLTSMQRPWQLPRRTLSMKDAVAVLAEAFPPEHGAVS